jgi:hypothetical protein
MSETDPGEIAASAIADVYGDGVRFDDLVPNTQNKLRGYARAVIAALEREGFKLMRREASEEMEIVALNTLPPMRVGDDPLWRACYKRIWDAAPSYAPVEQRQPDDDKKLRANQ